MSYQKGRFTMTHPRGDRRRAGNASSPTLSVSTRTRLSGNVRRAQILAGARQVFLEKGLAGARTKEIAQASGVPEGLIYRHFDSKEALFEAAILEPLQVLLKDLARSMDRIVPEHSSARLPEIERFHGEIFDGMIETAPLLGTALFADRDLGENFYRNRVLPLLDDVYRTIDSRLTTLTDVHTTARPIVMALLGAYTWVALDTAYNPDVIDRRTVVHDLARLFSRGLASLPPDHRADHGFREGQDPVGSLRDGQDSQGS
jgi:AcrR family transcriptional regulator